MRQEFRLGMSCGECSAVTRPEPREPEAWAWLRLSARTATDGLATAPGLPTRGGCIPRDRARQKSYCFYDFALKGMPCHFHRQDVLVKVVAEPARFIERELKFLSMEKCQVML